MLEPSDEVLEINVILREEIGRNRINETLSLGATGSTTTVYLWENRFHIDRLPVKSVTSSGPTYALGTVAAKLQATYEQQNQHESLQRRLANNQPKMLVDDMPKAD